MLFIAEPTYSNFYLHTLNYSKKKYLNFLKSIPELKVRIKEFNVKNFTLLTRIYLKLTPEIIM